MDTWIVKSFDKTFTVPWKLSRSVRRNLEALKIEAFELLYRVFRGQPPFCMPSEFGLVVARDAFTPEDRKRLNAGAMIEEGKNGIRDKVTETVLTLWKELTGKSELSVTLRIVRAAVFTPEERDKTIRELGVINFRRKIFQGIKTLRKQLTGSSERVSLFLQDSIEFANRLMALYELPVLYAARKSYQANPSGAKGERAAQNCRNREDRSKKNNREFLRLTRECLKDESVAVTELAERYGVHPVTIKRDLKKFGISVRSRLKQERLSPLPEAD